MVSKASEDLPEPERPVITVSVSRGISTSISLRLCSRAPRTDRWVSIGAVVPDLFCCYRGARDGSTRAVARWVRGAHKARRGNRRAGGEDADLAAVCGDVHAGRAGLGRPL